MPNATFPDSRPPWLAERISAARRHSLTAPVAHRTARRLARVTAALAGFAIGLVLLGRPAVGAVAGCVAIATLLTLVLHLVRQPKGNR